MAKKTRKVVRAARVAATPAKDGARWTVRGVPAGLQKAAGDAARARGLTLGQWLAEALEGAVGRDAPGPAGAAATAGWRETIERRLDRLEREVFAGTSASAAAEPAAVN